MEIQFELKNSLNPVDSQEAVSKSFVDNMSIDPSIIRNTAHVDFNYKILEIVRVEANSVPAVREHLTPNLFVDDAISHSVDETTLVRIDRNNQFNNNSLSNIAHITKF